ncbi:phosphotriesterase, partial [Salmonella enterica]|nr:phosphotriesterase [Salmonella enterica]EBN4174800.1 phosphotriesterase [Salmonella enterica subsp. enterica serovar Reading]EAW1890804.1 phosphotriesterase [Salmonella enterica]EBP8933246.1 phosphotriesterase [Salmonella enterica]ECG9675562.1 phosphotriesterase [Salmonella enterica]
MSYFKVWDWDKKLRTMLRFVKLGDIFCFKLDGDR